MDESAPRTADELRDWLRSLKLASGASFADIARAIGEEERTVKRWMPDKGRAVVPSGDALLRLLDYFGVTLTPPAPRAVALSLMGEVRETRAAIERLREAEDPDELSIRRVDARLEELAGLVGRALLALERLEAQGAQRPSGGGRSQKRAAP